MNFYHFGQPSLPPETLSKNISNLQCCVVLLYLRYEHPQPSAFNLTFGQKLYHPMTITYVKSNLNACDRCWRSPPADQLSLAPVVRPIFCEVLYIYLLLGSRLAGFQPRHQQWFTSWNFWSDTAWKTLKESKITKEALLNFPFSEWETQCLMFIDPFMV